MGLKNFKPYTKSTRGTVIVDKSLVWKGSRYKPLTKGQKSTGGRNNYGRITSRHRVGGSKHKFIPYDLIIYNDLNPLGLHSTESALEIKKYNKKIIYNKKRLQPFFSEEGKLN